MPRIEFTQNLQRHVRAPGCDVVGSTVGEVLQAYFSVYPEVRSYVLEDQGGLRKHMVIFVDGKQLEDRASLSDGVREDSEVYVMQALSGG